MNLKIGATIALLVQISLIIFGVYFLLEIEISDVIRYVWYGIITVNVIGGVVNIKNLME